MNTFKIYVSAHSSTLPYLAVKDYIYQLYLESLPSFVLNPLRLKQHFNSPPNDPKQILHLDLTPRRKKPIQVIKEF